MALTRDYQQWHAQRIRDDYVNDPAQITGYLSARLDEVQDVFLVGVRNVVDSLEDAVGPSKSGGTPKQIDELLLDDLNPRFSSIAKVLEELGLHLQCVVGKPLPVS